MRETDNIPAETDETKQIREAAGWSFFLNALPAAMKTLPACLSGSLAITASAIDSAADTVGC